MKKLVLSSVVVLLSACSTTHIPFFDMRNNDDKFQDYVTEERLKEKQEEDTAFTEKFSTILIQNCNKKTNECMFLKSYVKPFHPTQVTQSSRTEYIKSIEQFEGDIPKISYDYIDEGFFFEASQSSFDSTLNISLDTLDLLSLDVHHINDDLYLELPETRSSSFHTVIVEKDKISIVENKDGKLYIYWTD